MSSLHISVKKNVYPKFDILRMMDGGKWVKNVCNITAISVTMKEHNNTLWIGGSVFHEYISLLVLHLTSYDKTKI